MTAFYEFMVSKNKHAIFALALASKDLDLEEDYFRSSFRAILHFLTISVANKCDLSSYYQYNGKRYCHLSPHCCFLPPRAAQLRVAQPSKVVCQSKLPHHLRRPFSKVSLRLVYLWALFLHTLWPFHLRTVLASAAVRTRLQDHNVFRAPRVLGRPGPGPGGRLPTYIVGLFRCSREPKVSLPRRSRARRPSLPDRFRGQRSTLFRALGHLETQRLAPASKQAITSTTSPAPATSL